MELAIEFATFCNICFNKECLRKIDEFEHLTKILLIFIENKIVINGQEIYLCINCRETLESYDNFKEMCLRNFIDFRVEYSALKRKLEEYNDPDVEKKLRNFIETKVYGASETLNLYGCRDSLKGEHNVVSVQESESNLTKKINEGNKYNFHSVTCKKEKIDYEDNGEYKFHTELDLENSKNDYELPLPVEHIKLESYVEEDTEVAESCSKNTLIEPSKSTESYKTDKALPTSNDSTQHKEHTSADTLNKNPQPTNKEISDVECNVCKKTFVNTRNLKIHMRIHSGERPFTCAICNKSFTQSSTLKTHTAVHTGEKRYSCKVCNKTYAKLSNLKEHEWIHTGKKPHICTVCNKAFPLSIRLKKHMLIHTDEKPYTCLICNKNFKRLENLKGHERVHTGEKPYACSTCNKTFSNSGNLKIHELVHTGEKPYTCGVCQKSFRHINHLKVHERLHSGEKPYECSICNIRFTQLSTCETHKLTHSEEKPYSCSVCKRTFRWLNTLKEHERLHTGEQPYNCDICKKTFIRRNQLRMHKQKPCIPHVEDKVLEENGTENVFGTTYPVENISLKNEKDPCT